MTSSHTKTLLILLLSLFITITAIAEKKTPEDKDKEKKKSKLKEYAEVITAEAITKKGIFTVHQVDDKVYYEISPGTMGKEFLWVAQLSQAQSGYGFSGIPAGRRVVRWERHGNKILLKGIQYRIQAKPGTPEAISVNASNLPSIIGAYDITCFSKDQDPVIDVTELFTSDVPEFSPREFLDASSIDKSRTMINSIKVFPINIETRVLATYKPNPPKPNTYNPNAADSITVEVHHSMVKLPDKPMMPRLYDERVGFFGHTYENYSGADLQQVEKVSLIHRFRLEKKNPGAEISEPVQPIVFYIERGVPEKYKPYVKQGIEDWNIAFEQAGFKNAIIGKYAPSKEEDPDWDAEDARYSTIRWLPSTIENAMGPHVADPRSGETLEADVLVFHNVLKLARDWFYVQASPHDPTYQQLPLPDELMGELLRFITCHEVGHSLGLRHNFKASSQYSVQQIRDAEFTRQNGHTPSIMDYARFNYIAQPGDGASLIPRIGAYDKFAIEWGYKQFPNIKNPEDEKPLLDKIASRQLTDPFVRFGAGREIGTVGNADYTAQTEDLGSDAIEATQLGMKNLERIMQYIVKGTSKEGKNYDELRNMYNALLFQYTWEMGHVANRVGGVEMHNKVYGMDGDVYTPIDIAKQKEAVQFLNKNCFTLPGFLLNKDVIDRLGMHELVNLVGRVQERVLRVILNPEKADRINDIEAAGYPSYPVVELVGDVTAGIFTEINQPGAKIGALRRNLQRNLVKLLIEYTGNSKINGDLRAASRFHLDRLAKKLKRFQAGDRVTLSHVMNMGEEITTALKEEKKTQPVIEQ